MDTLQTEKYLRTIKQKNFEEILNITKCKLFKPQTIFKTLNIKILLIQRILKDM